MGRYRKIDPRIWNDQKFRSFSDNAKLVFLFILTHPYMTSLGAMRATISGLAEELHWEQKAFGKAFQEPLSKGMLKYDSEASCLVIPNFLKYNPPENPNVVKSWEKIVDLIPECELKVELFIYVKDFLKGLGEPFLAPLAKELERVCQNPNPNPNPNPIKEPPPTPRKRGAMRGVFYSEEFENFWNIYPKQVGKGDAWSKWQKLKKAGLLPENGKIQTAITEQSKSDQWRKDGGQFIPNPATWLNQARWDDKLQSAPEEARAW